MNVGRGDLYQISVNAMFGDGSYRTMKVLGTGGSEKYLC